MPFTLGAFLLGALSVVGLPPLGGSWSKFFLALGAAEAHQYVLVAVLMISTLLNVWYLLVPVVRAFFRPRPGGSNVTIAEAPLTCVVPLCLTAAGCIALFFYADGLYALLLPMTATP